MSPKKVGVKTTFAGGRQQTNVTVNRTDSTFSNGKGSFFYRRLQVHSLAIKNTCITQRYSIVLLFTFQYIHM
jgi:hypothetical protein